MAKTPRKRYVYPRKPRPSTAADPHDAKLGRVTRVLHDPLNREKSNHELAALARVDEKTIRIWRRTFGIPGLEQSTGRPLPPPTPPPPAPAPAEPPKPPARKPAAKKAAKPRAKPKPDA